MTGTRRKKIKNSEANTQKTRSRSAETVTGETIDMENVNSNHTPIKSAKQENAKRLLRVKSTVKSVKTAGAEDVVDLMDMGNNKDNMQHEVVHFEEDEEIVEMEANTAEMFKSDDEEEGDASSGESSDIDNAGNDSQNEGMEEDTTAVDETSEPESEAESIRQRKKKRTKRRMSVEDHLDQLTNSVQAMQEMMMIQQTNQRQGDKDTRKTKRSQTEERRNEGNQTNDVNESDTTIYQNILNKTPQKEEIRVDSEITFNKTGMRDSTSSEDQINMTDELMDVDIN